MKNVIYPDYMCFKFKRVEIRIGKSNVRLRNNKKVHINFLLGCLVKRVGWLSMTEKIIFNKQIHIALEIVHRWKTLSLAII